MYDVYLTCEVFRRKTRICLGWWGSDNWSADFYIDIILNSAQNLSSAQYLAGTYGNGYWSFEVRRLWQGVGSAQRQGWSAAVSYLIKKIISRPPLSLPCLKFWQKHIHKPDQVYCAWLGKGLLCLYILKKWRFGRVSPISDRQTDNRI